MFRPMIIRIKSLKIDVQKLVGIKIVACLSFGP